MAIKKNNNKTKDQAADILDDSAASQTAADDGETENQTPETDNQALYQLMRLERDQVLTSDKKKKDRSFLKTLAYAGVFMITFAIAFIYFLPLNQLAETAIRMLNRSGVDIEVGNIDASLSGKQVLQNVVYQAKSDNPSKKQSVKVQLAELDIGIFDYLNSDRLTLDAFLTSATIQLNKIVLEKGRWQIKAEIDNISSQANAYRGPVEITAQKVIINYNDAVPMIGEKISTIAGNILIQGKFQAGSLLIQKAMINTELAQIQLRGKVGLQSRAPIMLNVTIRPENTFYEKYKVLQIREMLTMMKVLSENGLIEMRVTGITGQPKVEIPSMSQPGPNAEPQ